MPSSLEQFFRQMDFSVGECVVKANKALCLLRSGRVTEARELVETLPKEVSTPIRHFKFAFPILLLRLWFLMYSDPFGGGMVWSRWSKWIGGVRVPHVCALSVWTSFCPVPSKSRCRRISELEPPSARKPVIG